MNETKLAKDNAREYIARHYCPDGYLSAPEPPFTNGKLDMGKFRAMASFIIDMMDYEMGHDTQWYRTKSDDDIRDAVEEWLTTMPRILKLPLDGNALQTLANLNEVPIEYLQRCGINENDAAYDLVSVFLDVIEVAYKQTGQEALEEKF